ncbi:hypothetical protein OSH10_06505 [Kaistia defluvii]|uniref:hypothetical protein n=1 Tax=Kaistia defluvii TaxID=410841 RepID=UPI0022548E3B|nr:hypothetical protein [Kaistia defluvii]MCX5518080.1 hypothetical protein [Kaistia defluvii]
MANGLFGTNIAAPEIRQAQLQPAAVPGSTFVRPQQREAGGNLRALADALGGLNGALQTYGTVVAKEEEDPQSRANRDWIAKRQLMSTDQLREEARLGTPAGVRVREDALNALLGEKANDDFRTRWTAFYNTEFDRTTGDAAAEYERLRQETAEALPNDLAKAAFYRLTKDHQSAWMQKDVEEKTSYVKQQINTTVIDSFRNSIDDSLNIHKLDPAKAAEIVFAKSASNRDFLGLSGQEQNETIFAIAEEYALKGNEELARALLDGVRKCSDGKKLPPLSKIAGYADKSIRLIEQAGSIRDKNVREGSFKVRVEDDDLILRGAFTEAEAEKRRGTGVYTDPELANMVDQSKRAGLAIQTKKATEEQKRALRVNSERERGRVIAQAYSAMQRVGGITSIRDVEIPSPTGEGTTTLSRAKSIEFVTDLFEENLEDRQAQLIERGTPEDVAKKQTQSARIAWYSMNRLDNAEWSHALNGIASLVTPETIAQRGQLLPQMTANAELYRTLKAANPGYLSTLITDKASREFLEVYDRAITTRRMQPDEALLMAAHEGAKDESTKVRSMVSQQDAAKIADRLLRDLGLKREGANAAFVMGRIHDMSRSGASEKEITAELQKEIEDTSVPINGVLVFDHRDLPADFPDLVQDELKGVFEVFGKRYGLPDVSDLFIVAESGESKWSVWSKQLRRPVGASMITPAMLDRRRGIRQAAQDELVRQTVAADDAKRADAQKRFEEEIAYERARLAETRKNGGRFMNWLADDHEERLNKRIAEAQAVRLRGEQERAKALREERQKRNKGGRQ